MEVNVIRAIIISILFSNSSSKNLSEVLSLRAVTYSSYLEEYYYSLYSKEPKTQPPQASDPVLDTVNKKTICQKIFSSPFFQMRDQEGIDTDESAIFEEIQERHQHIFPFVYKKSTDTNSFKFELYESDTAYHLFPFLYDLKEKNDYMFVCLVRKKRSQKMKVYFVSQVYDVNLADGSPIAGRFIFKDSHGTLVLKALAEEPAIESLLKKKAKFVEYRYIKRRQNEISDYTSSTDPICKLAPGNKIRLCATLFASKMFRKKYTFWPTRENVRLDCAWKQISFLKKKRVRTLLVVTRNHFDERKIYKELVIGCNATRVDSEEEVIYYVSRGDDKNTIFAYKHKFSDDRIFVTNYLKNVSVVDGISNENGADNDEHSIIDDDSDEDEEIVNERGESSKNGETPGGSEAHKAPKSQTVFSVDLT